MTTRDFFYVLCANPFQPRFFLKRCQTQQNRYCAYHDLTSISTARNCLSSPSCELHSLVGCLGSLVFSNTNRKTAQNRLPIGSTTSRP